MTIRPTPSWTLGHTADPAVAPASFVPATVPGAVQLDWARAAGWPDYWVAENFRAYAWMESAWWVYRTVLVQPRLQPGERLVLACGGVDYRCEVRLDGAVVHAHEGMFSPFNVDLSAAHDGSVLEIVVAPAPKTVIGAHEGDPMDLGRKESRQSCKPAVAYGWDFHPRLIPLGLWDETVIEVRPAAWLDHVEGAYDLAADLGRADLRLVTGGHHGGGASRVRWSMCDPEGAAAGTVEGDLPSKQEPHGIFAIP